MQGGHACRQPGDRVGQLQLQAGEGGDASRGMQWGLGQPAWAALPACLPACLSRAPHLYWLSTLTKRWLGWCDSNMASCAAAQGSLLKAGTALPVRAGCALCAGRRRQAGTSPGAAAGQAQGSPLRGGLLVTPIAPPAALHGTARGAGTVCCVLLQRRGHLSRANSTAPRCTAPAAAAGGGRPVLLRQACAPVYQSFAAWWCPWCSWGTVEACRHSLAEAAPSAVRRRGLRVRASWREAPPNCPRLMGSMAASAPPKTQGGGSRSLTKGRMASFSVSQWVTDNVKWCRDCRTGRMECSTTYFGRG